MIKHSLILLGGVLVVTMFVGCKPKNIDVDNSLKQVSEETFIKAPSRSFMEIKGNDMSIVEYTFNAAAMTATRKTMSFEQKSAYSGVHQEDFTYSWGEFCKGMFGRFLYLKGENGDRTLVYLNDQLNDGEITTTIREPRADMAANMIQGLTAGKWETEDPEYVLQLRWVDTIVYETHRQGKKIVVDTIYKRMPRPDFYDTIGKATITYFAYAFAKEDGSKTASLKTDLQINEVDTAYEYKPQIQDPSKFDTIITYSIKKEGTRAFVDSKEYESWCIADINVANDVQNLDVMVIEKDQEPVKLSFNNYLFGGGEGSFVLDKKTYLFIPKN